MKLVKLLSIATAILAVTISCNNEEDPVKPVEPTSGQKMPIKIGVTGSEFNTKANDYAFEDNDKVGIYVVDSGTSLQASGNYVNNMGFTYKGKWTADSPIYWKDEKTAADFYCYYPYTASISNSSSWAISVKEDQSTETNYRSSDFLWGKTTGAKPSSEAVGITVNHVVASIKVILQSGNGFTAEELNGASVEILPLKVNGTINLSTGAVTIIGSEKVITPLKETGCFSAYVLPQTITNAPFVKVTIGDNDYILNQTFTFESGKRYSCTIQVNKTDQDINIGIGAWVDGEDCGGVVY